MVIDRARVAGARCRDGRQGEEGGLGEQHLRGFTRLFLESRRSDRSANPRHREVALFVITCSRGFKPYKRSSLQNTTKSRPPHTLRIVPPLVALASVPLMYIADLRKLDDQRRIRLVIVLGCVARLDTGDGFAVKL